MIECTEVLILRHRVAFTHKYDLVGQRTEEMDSQPLV